MIVQARVMQLSYPPDSASPRMNQYERGKREPDLATARQIADCLGVPLPFLYCEQEDLATLIREFGSLKEVQREAVMQAVRNLLRE